MTQINTPNIFVLLEINPDQPWNQVDFEKRLEAKRQEWARAANMPTEKGRRARINLGHLAGIKRVASDETARNSQANEARQESLTRRNVKLRDLNERIDLL